MSDQATSDVTSRPSMGKIEFIALMALMGGAVAYAIDAMLPALPEIGQELSPDALNRAQLVVTSFVFGMGLGTFLVGPLSDAFGRRPVVLVGSGIFAVASVIAVFTASLELLIALRVVQGLGVSAARIVSMAIIRDLFAGREMARLMSFVTMVFMLVPAIAPLIGSLIIAVAGWRGVFASFILFAGLFSGWMMLRLAEPLPRGHRRPFHPRALWQAAREVVSHRVVILSTAVMTLCFAALFASLSTVQQIMGDTFGRADEFPYWFALIALISGSAAMLNAKLVIRYGMRFLVGATLGAQVVLCLVMLALTAVDMPPGLQFAVYIAWQSSVFCMASLTLGNLTSLAMEPLGHIAGMAASVISGLATVGSVLIAIPIGLAFDGTPVPLILGVMVCALLGRLLTIPLGRAEESSRQG